MPQGMGVQVPPRALPSLPGLASPDYFWPGEGELNGSGT
jgi:hypothetical protein